MQQNRGLLRFLLQKELRKSDVGSLGRMVLPKVGFPILYIPPVTMSIPLIAMASLRFHSEV